MVVRVRGGLQGNVLSKYLIPYARMIADDDVEQVPQISWGSGLLAVTYRGLCRAVTKGRVQEGIFLGCPLLLQV